MLALYVALAVAGVAAGGLIAVAALRIPPALAGLKGLAAGAVGTLVFFHILPEVVAQSGTVGLAVAIGAFAALHLVERLGNTHGAAHPHGRFGAAELVLSALLIHSALDGVGLAAATTKAGATGTGVVAAIVGHQLPVAAILMWTFLQRRSTRGAIARLGLVAASILAGAIGGEAVLRTFEPIEPYALAFASGTLLHVLGHEFAGHHAHRPSDRAVEAATFVAAAAGTLLIPQINPWGGHAAPEARRFAETAVVMLAAGAPLYLAGLAAAGVLRAAVRTQPQEASLLSAVRAGTLCACDVHPGAALTPRDAAPRDAIAFLVVAAGLGLDGLALGIAFVGWHLTLARILAVLVCAGTLGIIAAAVARRNPYGPTNTPDENDPPAIPALPDTSPTADRRTSALARFASGVAETADHSGPWLVLGLVTASAILLVIPADLPARVPPPWDTAAASAIALPVYLCAPAAVPIAAALLLAGFSPGAAVAWMVLGPTVSATQLRTLGRLYGPLAAAVLAAGSAAIAFGAGAAVNALGVDGTLPAARSPAEIPPAQWACVAAVASFFIAAFFRVGPLHWIATVGGVVPTGTIHGPRCECEAGTREENENMPVHEDGDEYDHEPEHDHVHVHVHDHHGGEGKAR